MFGKFIIPTSDKKIASMNDEQLFEMKSKLNKALAYYSGNASSSNASIIDNIHHLLDEIENQENFRQYNKNVQDLSKMKGRKGQVIKDPSVIMDDIEEPKFNEDDW